MVRVQDAAGLSSDTQGRRIFDSEMERKKVEKLGRSMSDPFMYI
jgi:hypothetical protein